MGERNRWGDLQRSAALHDAKPPIGLCNARPPRLGAAPGAPTSTAAGLRCGRLSPKSMAGSMKYVTMGLAAVLTSDCIRRGSGAGSPRAFGHALNVVGMEVRCDD